MRAVTIAAVIGLLAAATSAYAQGQASASMTVSVRVVRTCTVATAPAVPDSPRITTDCAGRVEPRTELSNPAPAESPRPSTASADARAFRVLTVNF